MQAIDAPGAGFCDACLTGNYPVPVPVPVRRAGPALRRGRYAGVSGSADRPRPAADPSRCRDADADARSAAPTSAQPPATYAGAGVDIDAGERAVELIKPLVASTLRPEVLGGLGDFGGLFALDTARYRQPVLVAGTDGVGTKALVAQDLGRFDTIGIDLVAMCVDDLVCQGAEPLFLLDYISSGLGRSGPDGRAGGGGGRRLPPGGGHACSAARWPSTPGS